MSGGTAYAILAIACLIALSAFFSAAQTGFDAASNARLAELARRGVPRARIALALLEAPERLKGALLFGCILANAAATAVATLALIRFLGVAGGVLLAAGMMPLIILAFAELLPRTYAAIHPERVALVAAPAVRVIAAVLGPFATAVGQAMQSILKALGASAGDAMGPASAHDELRDAIDLRHKDESLVKEDRDRLGGILNLKDLEVADIMIHRTKMKSLDLSLPARELVEAMLESPHTRLPVWRGKPDNIIGVLHAKAVFAALQEAGGDAGGIEFEKIVTPAWFVPDTRPLEDQLNAFLRRKTHFALVVDEYGEVQGLVTLEDILEEIVGDIKDEFDTANTGVRKTRDGAYLIDGTVPIRDLNRSFDWSLPDEEATTLAGLVIHEARMIPEAGQAFSFHGFKFEVVKKRKQQITQIKVTRTGQPAGEDRPG